MKQKVLLNETSRDAYKKKKRNDPRSIAIFLYVWQQCCILRLRENDTSNPKEAPFRDLCNLEQLTLSLKVGGGKYRYWSNLPLVMM